MPKPEVQHASNRRSNHDGSNNTAMICRRLKPVARDTTHAQRSSGLLDTNLMTLRVSGLEFRV